MAPPIMGQVACQVTRAELKQIFEQSGYGSNIALFDAYFVKDSRPPLCVVCRNPISMHLDNPQGESNGMGNVLGGTQPRVEKPDKTVAELRQIVLAYNEKNSTRLPIPFAMPPQWLDSPFRVFSYYNFKDTDLIFRNGQFPAVKAIWQCAAGSEEFPCTFTAHTDGLQILNPIIWKSKRGAHMDINSINVGTQIYNPSKEHLDEMRKHLLEVHHIDVDANFRENFVRTRGWNSELCGCTEHPGSCIDCLCCYPCGLNCWCPLMDPFVRQHCMVARLNRITNNTANQMTICMFCQDYEHKNTFTVAAHDPSQSLCNACDVLCCYPVMGFTMFISLWIYTTPIVAITQLLTSIFTLCGLPCRSMPPALHNDCYQHRRYLVDQQGIDESHCKSKLISLFCWPCSECQVWRELQYNGIWPGLCLFSASAQERVLLEPATVRHRLVGRLVPPVGPSSMGSPEYARVGACTAQV